MPAGPGDLGGRLRKVAEDYDPTSRDRAYSYVRDRHKAGEIVTGLLYIDPASRDLHDQSGTVKVPLTTLTHEQLCPGAAELERLQMRFREGITGGRARPCRAPRRTRRQSRARSTRRLAFITRVDGTMKCPPILVGGARVVRWSPVDGRHRT